MAVYASLIGAPGLGLEILEAIGRFDIGWGFESGVSVVILAVIIDRITQGMSMSRTR
jgi:glycine betaine/proline transport system permease protein